MWQSSRPAALRVRNGGPKLRELTADELEQIQRAKDRAAEVERAAVLAAAAAGRARTRSDDARAAGSDASALHIRSPAPRPTRTRPLGRSPVPRKPPHTSDVRVRVASTGLGASGRLAPRLAPR